VLDRMAAFCFHAWPLPLFEIALVLVRLNHVASVIVNANHDIISTDFLSGMQANSPVFG
jgi:hypothetical protein